MADWTVIWLTACLVAASCALLGSLLVVRRQALLGDAISHAVLPGIVVAFLVVGSRDPLPMILGASAFAVACVLAVEGLERTGLVRSDAAIGLVFPALFSLGVLGVHVGARNVHLDLDATVFGEIAFAPLRLMEVAGTWVPRSLVLGGVLVLVNTLLLVAAWNRIKVAAFDPRFADAAGLRPRLVNRLVLVAVAITSVVAFESVGAILVVALLIVPAATAFLVAPGLASMLVLAVAFGLVAATGGTWLAWGLDTNVGGSMGTVAAATCGIVLAATGVRRRLRRHAHRNDSAADLPIGG